MGRVGWLTLTPALTPFPAVTAVLSSTSESLHYGPMTLTAAVVMTASVSLLDALYVASVSALLVRRYDMS